MKFGIIICPKCKNPKAIDLFHKSTTCPRCNKKIIISKVRILHKTNNRGDLHYIIGVLNSEKDGKSKDFEKIFKKNI